MRAPRQSSTLRSVRSGTDDLERSANEEVDVLIFVVGRTRLDRYEELRLHFKDWRDVRVVLDRREGERREPNDTFAGVERRREWSDAIRPSPP